MLSRATSFLHREYKADAYLWELVEMSRRVLLVGVYVVGPYHPGSMMQLSLATATAVATFVSSIRHLYVDTGFSTTTYTEQTPSTKTYTEQTASTKTYSKREV